MEMLLKKAKLEFGYSDKEISMIRYTLTALLYDLSKMILYGIFFYYLGMLIHYLFAAVPLILLRTKNGGIHFKHYVSCLLFTFAFLYAVIVVLPTYVSILPIYLYPILLLCVLINCLIGPNSMNRKKRPDDAYIKEARIHTIRVITFIAVLLFIFSASDYLIVSFWTVVLYTIQMMITPFAKEVKYHEKAVKQDSLPTV